MKPESLQALLIDRELGELTPEAVELLDAWLNAHPESRADAASIRRTLGTLRGAVLRHPELARPESKVLPWPVARPVRVAFALAASIALMLAGTAWLAFRAGQNSAPDAVAANHREPAAAPPGRAVTQNGPWARYALVSHPGGGLTVVRRDAKPQS